MLLLRYLAQLPVGHRILWSYVIWWAVMMHYYFRMDVRLWLMSLGIGIIVGFALMLSTGPVSIERFRSRFWESLRLFICPFMVSIFSALVVGRDFILVFSPRWMENTAALSGIAVFLLLVFISKRILLRG